jgi:hypothetical protein
MGGWNLHLFENGITMGLIDFPATESENAHIHPMNLAFLCAEAEANLWMKGRRVYSKRRMRLVVHPVPAVLFGLVVLFESYKMLRYIL